VIRGPVAAAVLLVLAFARSVVALEPQEQLVNPVLEARARKIGHELRCPVCQNQSIDDSNADLARDLRRIVRERLTAGDSDDQALTFIADRYGDFVLLRPPFRVGTLLLWLGPAMLLLAAIVALILRRRRNTAVVLPLSVEENRCLNSLLGEETTR
jgi:cytochrome c-type biogenesis protein CcmH